MTITYKTNPGGPTIGTVSAPVLEAEGLFFKDLERTGTLLPYEDWRLPPEERARDLASRLTVEEIAGLMMYSSHQMVPGVSEGPFIGTYGGNNNIVPILEAYRLGCEKHGEEAMLARFRRSAARLLTNAFRCSLFENPYLDAEESQRLVGCADHCEAGFDAQLKSVVMVKNTGCLPIQGAGKVYIPNRHVRSRMSFFHTPIPAQDLPGADRAGVEKYYSWTETPEKADFAIVFIESSLSDGYSQETGYRPVTLQYRPYTAHSAREHSIGQGDFREQDDPDRSYRGKSNTAANESDLELVLRTRAAMGSKPVIVVVRMHNPCVLAELEEAADAILVDFGVQQEAILALISGKAEPSGLLPVQLPKDMDTVERHCEDRPLDLEPYRDSQGNAYDFAFGLNWSGPIRDARTERYAKF